jgi:hypothetical protein
MKKKLASCEVRGGSQGGDEKTGLLINPKTCGHNWVYEKENVVISSLKVSFAPFVFTPVHLLLTVEIL